MTVKGWIVVHEHIIHWALDVRIDAVGTGAGLYVWRRFSAFIRIYILIYLIVLSVNKKIQKRER